MDFGLEWQNGHVQQGLSVQARVHQGNLGVLYNRVGSLAERGSRVNMYSNTRYRGATEHFSTGTRRVGLSTHPSPQCPVLPPVPTYHSCNPYRDPRQFSVSC